MQYLGGKARLAKHLVAAIRAEIGNSPVWDPFCGGLSMTVEFAKRSNGVATDSHPALMALYTAMRSGWEPPEHLSKQEYLDAKNLPDANPIKAYAGFGHSFGGKWFGGYAPVSEHFYYGSTSRVLRRQLAATKHWEFRREVFEDSTPSRTKAAIYADPPYAGTTGYGSVFDHDVFWKHCRDWARYTPVYVSEFSCPVQARTVIELVRNRAVSGSTGTCVDKLYAIGASPRMFAVPRQLQLTL